MLVYLPVAFFGLWGLYMHVRFGNIFRDPAIVRHPENRFWHPFRLFDNREWTEHGRAVRGRWLAHLVVGFGIAAVSLAVVAGMEARG
jgi:hypothetical protein